MFSARDQHCELRTAVERLGDDRFALYYELRSRSDLTLFVFDQVEPAEAPFYVERSGNLVVLSQKLVTPPQGLELERPEIPLASRVEPGQKLRHKLEVPLPLRESIPYPHLLPRQARSDSYLVMDAHFEVGYFAADDPDLAMEAGEGFVLPGFDPAQQTAVRVGPIGRIAFDPSRR